MCVSVCGCGHVCVFARGAIRMGVCRCGPAVLVSCEVGGQNGTGPDPELRGEWAEEGGGGVTRAQTVHGPGQAAALPPGPRGSDCISRALG